MRIARVLVPLVLVVSACGAPPTAGPGQGADGETEAAGTAATGGGLEEVLAELEGMTGEERRSRLVELAEEDGQFSLYTSMSGPIVNEIVGVFEDEFGLDVGLYRASSETVLQRLIEENRAGFPGADVVETNGTEMFALSSEGILLPAASPVTENQVEGALFEDWTATRFNIFAVSWNTDLVDQPPTSWEGLADPSWDGRLAMELGDTDWYMALHDYWIEQGRSEEEVQQIFEDMARGALTVSGHTLMGQLLAAGEFAAATSNYSYITQAAIDDGAPIAWQPPVEPVIARPNGVGFVQGLQHPAAALLFYEWVLSDGQEVLRDVGGVDPSRADLLSTGDAEIVYVDLDKYAAERDPLTDRYVELMQLGEELEE